MNFERDKHMVIACFACSIEQLSFRKHADCFIDLCEFIGHYVESTLEFLELNFQNFIVLFDYCHYNCSDTIDRS